MHGQQNVKKCLESITIQTFYLTLFYKIFLKCSISAAFTDMFHMWSPKYIYFSTLDL